ncbi:MAG: maleylacetoacetate isomerase [Pseudomonadota bacterium]|jgi:maleylpyruvate isomerase|nr:maleylacetoacetate isomerase [Oxalobacteraceae bacterium]
MLTLHNYFRSSAAYRVRIAMNLKGLDYDYVPVHLTRDGGMQFKEPYKSLNPQQLVPLLDDDGFQISQSLAIIEYLDEKFPNTRLLPKSPEGRARVRQIALAISCDIHPLQNLRVLKYLTGTLGASEESKTQWIHHWLSEGLAALEADLSRAPTRGRFCFGDTPSMADCTLVPQMFSAARFNVDTVPYPTLRAIYAACEAIPAVAAAHPSRQMDAE